jgi:hypothetical protein
LEVSSDDILNEAVLAIIERTNKDNSLQKKRDEI